MKFQREILWFIFGLQVFCTPVIFGQFPPEEKFDSVGETRGTRPGYLESVPDPDFGNRVTRITDAEVFGYADPRHGYSKTQPWNSNGQYIRIRHWLLDGNTYKVIRKIPYLDEAKWSHLHPLEIYGFQGKGRFVRLSIDDDQITLLREFTGYDELRMGPWEGNLSHDDTTVVFAAKKDEDLTVIVYDIAGDAIVATQLFRGAWKRLDWVSVSPSGKYILFNWHPGELTQAKVIDCYNHDLEFIRRLADQGCHGDMGFAADGTELYVQFEFGDQRGIWAYQLADGKRQRLLPDKYNGGHLSFQNFRRPGWCYLSCNKQGYREVFALKTDGSGTVQRFAHHYSSAKKYLSEAQAVPNPDGNKVMFASDWGGEVEVNSFVVEISVPDEVHSP